MYYTLYDSIMHSCYFLQIRKWNLMRASGRFVLFVIRCDIFYLLFHLYNIVLFSYCISNDNKYLLNFLIECMHMQIFSYDSCLRLEKWFRTIHNLLEKWSLYMEY